MGGRLGIHVAIGPDAPGAAARDAQRVAGRVVAWSRLLTRHDPTSPLMRLNGDPNAAVLVPPTLAAALAWAADAGRMTGGLVDVTRLARAARGRVRRTGFGPGGSRRPCRRHRLLPGGGVDVDGRRRTTVTRTPGTRLDLDGVAKGWIADRALRLLERYPGAVVDADGDVALRVAPGDRWEIGVADPRGVDDLLAVVVLADEPGAAGRGRRTWGVATSGTSVHRFGPGPTT